MKSFSIPPASLRVHGHPLRAESAHNLGRGEPALSPSARKNRVPSLGGARLAFRGAWRGELGVCTMCTLLPSD
jgi:hypothetical protein